MIDSVSQYIQDSADRNNWVDSITNGDFPTPLDPNKVDIPNERTAAIMVAALAAVYAIKEA